MLLRLFYQKFLQHLYTSLPRHPTAFTNKTISAIFRVPRCSPAAAWAFHFVCHHTLNLEQGG